MTPPPASDAENATFSRKCYRSITQRERRGHAPALQSVCAKQQFIALFQSKPKNKNAAELGSVIIQPGNQTARSTLLERRHLVQAYTWQGVPLTTALTRFTLGFQARLERLWEWETLIPKVTPLPQKSHFAISLHLPSE